MSFTSDVKRVCAKELALRLAECRRTIREHPTLDSVQLGVMIERLKSMQNDLILGINDGKLGDLVEKIISDKSVFDIILEEFKNNAANTLEILPVGIPLGRSRLGPNDRKKFAKMKHSVMASLRNDIERIESILAVQPNNSEMVRLRPIVLGYIDEVHEVSKSYNFDALVELTPKHKITREQVGKAYPKSKRSTGG